jgi:hypothetical protein
LRYRRLESGSYSLAMRLPSMKTSSEVPWVEPCALETIASNCRVKSASGELSESLETPSLQNWLLPLTFSVHPLPTPTYSSSVRYWIELLLLLWVHPLKNEQNIIPLSIKKKILCNIYL